LYFLPVIPSKSRLANFREAGVIALATRQFIQEKMRKEDKAKYNYKRIEIYLSPKDAALFEKKAVHYKNWGPFIRDAVKQFNDIGTLRRIDALNETALYKKYQQELSWIGDNLNQAVKRANELAIDGKLDQFYYDNVIFPQVREIQILICEIKDEQHTIAKKLIRL
jgi:hypothetical protein